MLLNVHDLEKHSTQKLNSIIAFIGAIMITDAFNVN